MDKSKANIIRLCCYIPTLILCVYIGVFLMIDTLNIVLLALIKIVSVITIPFLVIYPIESFIENYENRQLKKIKSRTQRELELLNKNDMEELKIEVPSGYEIDKENSTFECIKFKEKEKGIKSWEDYMLIERATWELVKKTADRIQDLEYSLGRLFDDKTVRRIVAEYKIKILMFYYGGAFTEEEWNDNRITKYTIIRYREALRFPTTSWEYSLLAFRTHNQRMSFLENNEQLVRDYLMLD